MVEIRTMMVYTIPLIEPIASRPNGRTNVITPMNMLKMPANFANFSLSPTNVSSS